MVESNNLTGNTQSKSKMLSVISCRVRSVETAEDRCLGRVRNSGTIIYDCETETSGILRKSKLNFSMFRYITDGIVQKDSQNLTDPFRVTTAERKLFIRFSVFCLSTGERSSGDSETGRGK